jgi:Na+-transporting methylmalonyl-CoA/oxaloacetate decarboxylase gamma subunit
MSNASLFFMVLTLFYALIWLMGLVERRKIRVRQAPAIENLRKVLTEAGVQKADSMSDADAILKARLMRHDNSAVEEALNQIPQWWLC